MMNIRIFREPDRRQRINYSVITVTIYLNEMIFWTVKILVELDHQALEES